MMLGYFVVDLVILWIKPTISGNYLKFKIQILNALEIAIMLAYLVIWYVSNMLSTFS